MSEQLSWNSDVAVPVDGIRVTLRVPEEVPLGKLCSEEYGYSKPQKDKQGFVYICREMAGVVITMKRVGPSLFLYINGVDLAVPSSLHFALASAIKDLQDVLPEPMLGSNALDRVAHYYGEQASSASQQVQAPGTPVDNTVQPSQGQVVQQASGIVQQSVVQQGVQQQTPAFVQTGFSYNS